MAIARFLVRRVALGILTLFAISVIVFVLFYVAPNDPARSIAGPQATFEVVAHVRHTLGLDQPLPQRYWKFLTGMLHGDFGYSYYSQQPVTQQITQRLPVTLSLAVGSAAIFTVLGVGIGVSSARRPGSFRDRFGAIFVLTGLSFPTFVFGLVLLYGLFYQLTLHGITFFPGSGYVPIETSPLQWAQHLLLPWATVAFVSAATYARLSRAMMLDVLSEDYIRTARAKGLSERVVVYKHAMRSALTPLVTQLGVDFAALLGGLVVTERIFGLQGIGSLAVDAVSRGDQPTIIGVVLLASFFVVVMNILIDLVYALLDARVRTT
jgi:peptide/nickel transport system permease protein